MDVEGALYLSTDFGVVVCLCRATVTSVGVLSIRSDAGFCVVNDREERWFLVIDLEVRYVGRLRATEQQVLLKFQEFSERIIGECVYFLSCGEYRFFFLAIDFGVLGNR